MVMAEEGSHDMGAMGAMAASSDMGAMTEARAAPSRGGCEGLARGGRDGEQQSRDKRCSPPGGCSP